MSEYHIVFKENEDGSMDLGVEIIGEDDTATTKIGDHFYTLIKNAISKLEEELEDE